MPMLAGGGIPGGMLDMWRGTGGADMGMELAAQSMKMSRAMILQCSTFMTAAVKRTSGWKRHVRPKDPGCALTQSFVRVDVVQHQSVGDCQAMSGSRSRQV